MDLGSIEVQENQSLGLSGLGQRTFGGLGSYCITPAKPGVVTVSMPDGEAFEFEPVVSCDRLPGALDDALARRSPLARDHVVVEAHR